MHGLDINEKTQGRREGQGRGYAMLHSIFNLQHIRHTRCNNPDVCKNNKRIILVDGLIYLP
jgi:hypothetical protein